MHVQTARATHGRRGARKPRFVITRLYGARRLHPVNSYAGVAGTAVWRSREPSCRCTKGIGHALRRCCACDAFPRRGRRAFRASSSIGAVCARRALLACEHVGQVQRSMGTIASWSDPSPHHPRRGVASRLLKLANASADHGWKAVVICGASAALAIARSCPSIAGEPLSSFTSSASPHVGDRRPLPAASGARPDHRAAAFSRGNIHDVAQVVRA